MVWEYKSVVLIRQRERDDALQRYHGDSLPRLKRIKSQVDPGNIFWNPQSVM